jgi:hypothetical protein
MAGSGEVRKRRREETSADQKQDYRNESVDAKSASSSPGEGRRGSEGEWMEPGSYWLTRITFIRALGFIYCM